jgi:hypothetical protein
MACGIAPRSCVKNDAAAMWMPSRRDGFRSYAALPGNYPIRR